MRGRARQGWTSKLDLIISLMCLLGLGLGCATLEPSVLVQRKFEPISPNPKRILLPPLNEATVARVGDSMVSSGSLFTRPAIRLLETVSHSGDSKGPYTIALPAGVYFASGRSSFPIGGTFFQFPTPLPFRWEGGAFLQPGSGVVRGGIFVPDHEGGTPQIYWHATDTGVPLTDPNPTIRSETTVHEEFQADSFHRELVYNGRSGDTIKLIYREFIDNRIRPAFTQEVSYDLEQGEEIGFKGARFRVHDANNVEIRYTATSHLE